MMTNAPGWHRTAWKKYDYESVRSIFLYMYYEGPRRNAYIFNKNEIRFLHQQQTVYRGEPALNFILYIITCI